MGAIATKQRSIINSAQACLARIFVSTHPSHQVMSTEAAGTAWLAGVWPSLLLQLQLADSMQLLLFVLLPSASHC